MVLTSFILVPRRRTVALAGMVTELLPDCNPNVAFMWYTRMCQEFCHSSQRLRVQLSVHSACPGLGSWLLSRASGSSPPSGMYRPLALSDIPNRASGPVWREATERAVEPVGRVGAGAFFHGRGIVGPLRHRGAWPVME